MAIRKHCGTGNCSHFDEIPTPREVYVENPVSLLAKPKGKNSVKLYTDTDQGEGVTISADESIDIRYEKDNKVSLRTKAFVWNYID